MVTSIDNPEHKTLWIKKEEKEAAEKAPKNPELPRKIKKVTSAQNPQVTEKVTTGLTNEKEKNPPAKVIIPVEYRSIIANYKNASIVPPQRTRWIEVSINGENISLKDFACSVMPDKNWWLHYREDWKDIATLSNLEIGWNISRGSDIIKLLQVYLYQNGYSVRDGNSATSIKSIDGIVKDNTESAIMAYQREVIKTNSFVRTKIDNFIKSIQRTWKEDTDLQDRRKPTWRVFGDEISFNSYGANSKYDMKTGEISTLVNGSEVSINAKGLVYNLDFKDFLNNESIDTTDRIPAVAWTMNLLNRAIYLLKTTPTYSKENPKFQKASSLIGREVIEFSSWKMPLIYKKQLIRVDNLYKYLKPLGISVDNFVVHLNNMCLKNKPVSRQEFAQNTNGQKNIS